ncbi:PDZ domain-containing protein [Vagococcus sp. BWB3-3]|uniref:endopeptidase La n=1 Tax=Vagococcus allomyrinae TaxID=2794353 RepID=A0A940PAY3_9ENTE|nr:SepM family pheromone-processing serine protease [Vagococcus allomyrinae]MBP1041395.1 PDZ domain-containing protein [Vagococcus allomyrinae]
MSRNKKDIIKYGLVILLSILVVASVIVPLPYYIEVPGSAENVRDFVSVDDKRNKNDGSFMLTTVGIRRGTLASLITAKFLPFQDVISQQDLMGDSTDEEYDKLTKLQMTSSENMAKKVALELAGEPYKFAFKGVYVMNVSDTSDFKGKLETGDIVTKVDNQTFESAKEFMDYVKSKKVGDVVTVTYERDGQEAEAKGKLMTLKVKDEEDRPGIGITLTDSTELQTDRDVVIHTEDIGGPSAGLMFTLELYDLLSGKDLRKGREIAGTGTINEDGSVGSIGGIDKKVVAADSEGATIFFAPNEPIEGSQTNYEEAVEAAKKIDTKMKIVPVKTVQDALNYLEK